MSLFISLYQFIDSDITYGILSLFYTSIFWTGAVYNKIKSELKIDKYDSNINRFIVATILLGLFIGGACTFFILVIL